MNAKATQRSISSRTRRLLAVATAGAIAVLYGSFVVFVATGPYEGFTGEFFNHGVYNVLILLPVIACFYRAFRVRREAVAWTVIGIGCLSYFIGEMYWAFALADLDKPPYPSVADFFYLGLYPCLLVGTIMLVRERVSEVKSSMWMHGMVAALAVASLDAALVVDAIGSQSGMDPAEVATNLSYVVGDMFLLMIVFGVWALTGWRPSAIWVLLGVSFVLQAIGDSAYFYASMTSSYVEGSWIDLFWPAALLLLLVAASRPAEQVRAVGEPGHWTMVPSVAFAGLALGLLIWDHFNPLGVFALSLSIAAVLVAVIQMGIALAENLQLLKRSREEAFTDQLTGLANRRRLMLDLEEACDRASDARPLVFAIFDLNGFKEFNDHFGHPAGDALLRRLGLRLKQAASPEGTAYRMGGDEFCVIARIEPHELSRYVADAAAGLTEHGHTYDVVPACGSVLVPLDASSASDVLRVADHRMYENKSELKEAALAADPLHGLAVPNTEQLDPRGGLEAVRAKHRAA